LQRNLLNLAKFLDNVLVDDKTENNLDESPLKNVLETKNWHQSCLDVNGS